MVHYRIYNSPPPVPILSRINQVHMHPFYFRKIQLNIFLPSTPGSYKWSLSLRYPPSKSCLHFSPIHATCPAYLIFFRLITRTIFVEKYRSLISSLCSCLYPPITRPTKAHIISSGPYSQTPSTYVPTSM